MKINSSIHHPAAYADPVPVSLKDLSPKNAGHILSQALDKTNIYCLKQGLPLVGAGSLGKSQFDTIDPHQLLAIRLLSIGGGAFGIPAKLSLKKNETTLKAPEELHQELIRILTAHQHGGHI